MHKLAASAALLLLLGCNEPRLEEAAKAPPAPPPPAPAKVAPAPASAPAATAAPAKPAGTVVARYALDREAMGKVYDAEVAKLPPKDRPAGKIGAEIMKLTEVKLTLYEGGSGEMATTKPADKGQTPKPTTEALTWQRKGKELTLTGPKELKRPMKCSGAGATMSCTQEGAPTKMRFKRL
jgi:hypothetical protein